MKTFLWLLTIALSVLCLCCWALSTLIIRSLDERIHDYLVPAITVAVLHPNVWILFCPLPWIVYSAVLSLRRELSSSAVFLFAGTIGLAATLLVCVVVLGCVLPYIPLKVGLAK